MKNSWNSHLGSSFNLWSVQIASKSLPKSPYKSLLPHKKVLNSLIRFQSFPQNKFFMIYSIFSTPVASVIKLGQYFFPWFDFEIDAIFQIESIFWCRLRLNSIRLAGKPFRLFSHKFFFLKSFFELGLDCNYAGKKFAF